VWAVDLGLPHLCCREITTLLDVSYSRVFQVGKPHAGSFFPGFPPAAPGDAGDTENEQSKSP
jgi:hypothetical protein